MFNRKLKRRIASLESDIRSLRADVRFHSDRYNRTDRTLSKLLEYLEIEEVRQPATIIVEKENA